MNEGQLIIDYQETLERNMSLILENAKLQQRIDKAIEYIKNIDDEEFINTEHYVEILEILGDKENE